MERTTQNKAKKDAIIAINVPVDLLGVIDQIRDGTSRSRFIRKLILEALRVRVEREQKEVAE